MLETEGLQQNGRSTISANERNRKYDAQGRRERVQGKGQSGSKGKKKKKKKKKKKRKPKVPFKK